jgi:hypothetical protein
MHQWLDIYGTLHYTACPTQYYLLLPDMCGSASNPLIVKNMIALEPTAAIRGNVTTFAFMIIAKSNDILTVL